MNSTKKVSASKLLRPEKEFPHLIIKKIVFTPNMLICKQVAYNTERGS